MGGNLLLGLKKTTKKKRLAQLLGILNLGSLVPAGSLGTQAERLLQRDQVRKWVCRKTHAGSCEEEPY